MKASKTTNVAMAIAAASLFAFAPMSVVHAGDDAGVKCFGVNACKGQNDCKSAGNACKGKAACKGQGFLKMSKAACDKAEGSVGKPAS
jgi:uncharacterized membrane protein